MNRALAFSIAALPFVAAFGLYATGTLERIDDALGMRMDRRKFGLDKPKPGRTQPLFQYVGWWQRDSVPNYGEEWVARVIVRAEGGRAWLRMWHECRPRYCEQGEFEAEVYGRSPDAVYALEVVRRKGKDVLWSVSLRPGDHSNALLILDDRRARDPQKKPHDNQSSFTALKRVK
ncbi:MAG TPA: hypothetical protein VIA19_14955 [Burkholderiales bacterium]